MGKGNRDERRFGGFGCGTARLWAGPARALSRGGVHVTAWLIGAMLGGAACAAGAPDADDVCHTAPAVGVAPGLSRTVASYPVPAIRLTGVDGKRLTAAEAIDDGRPVMLNFVYTSCNTVCPVTSQVFMQTRELLGEQRERLNMVSISIDPEQDTPRKLAAYAKRFAAAGQWAHYTGSVAESQALQRAFAAWRGDKMNHQPITFLRAAPGQPWVRLDGFASPDQLLAEYRRLMVGRS
jgi:protein SCO1/2